MIKFQFNFDKVQKKLEERFDALPEEVEKELDKALLKSAMLVEGDAVVLSPVDKGDLRRSIGYRKGKGLSYEVFAGAEHAKFVEFGTIKMKAQPFLRPAFYKNEENIKKLIKEAVSKAIKK